MDEETAAPVDELEAMVEDEEDLGDGAVTRQGQCQSRIEGGTC